MSKKKTTPQPAAQETPRIYLATRGSGPQGRVIRGAEVSFGEAVRYRLIGLSVVVCAGLLRANRDTGQGIENAVGRPNMRHDPHASAGPYALPHFQQVSPALEGHSFYETENRKAAKNP